VIKPAQQSNKVGAVLVIGGGVAGIQASLDLADSGQKVYLLEKSPAIGGYMARLDKTFPTNDCSMCILSPKIVECGRHLNIDTLTWSELQDVSGEAGNFKVKVRRKARYVDLEKCTGCGDCAKVCPVSFPDEFDAELGNRKAVFRPYPQAFPNAFVIDKRGKAPCRIGCPAGININAYVALTAAGKFDEALDVILETVPLPAVLGRVCDHPCEIECHLGSSHEPVAICALKRFLADYRREKGTYKAAPKVEQNLAKVAIIGSGPAGLAAARELARKGYKPEIFESRDKAGGMLRWGIPDYRLPPDVLDADIQDVLDEGVKLHLNKKLGKDFTLAELKKQGFEAVVLAVGAQLGSKFPVEGYDLDGFVDCIDFLNQANINPKTKVGEKVTVIGGGNSAVDAARVALRLGAKEVTIVYRRTRAEMPAIEEEIHAVEKEGINIIYLTAPSRLIAEGDRVRAMECVRMKLGEPDESGRRRPVKVAGSEFIIETDMVISAIGQKVDLSGDDEDSKKLSVTKWGTIDADSENASTNLDGVFAAGDAATGPASVIKAIAQGRKAANAVDCYLRKVPFTPEPQVKPEDITDNPPAVEESDIKVPRCKPEEIPLEKRIVNFDEVEKTFTEEQAIAEANRCLRCAVCSECMACVTACKAEAICHDAEDEIEEIHVGSIVAVPGFEEYLSKLKYDYGYSRYPDVVSSVQFERILSASGPFAGHVQRPSDGVVPKKIAFLQCVGSRDMSCRNDYCSSVCCMYAIKEAVIAKEHLKGVDVTIFFMDMRAFGKDFDKYYERAKSEYGVKFVRARVSDVFKNNGDSRLTVQYSSESGCVENDDFDMVVLSVGLESSAELRELGKKLKIRVEPNGFFYSRPDEPLCSSREGIFLAGAACGPKDIPETVIQASGAAGKAAGFLSQARNTLTVERQYPQQKDVRGQTPRIGVFVCHCGINIGGIVDVPSVTEYAKSLPFVVYAEENLYTCSQDTQEHIKEMIVEHNLNRVVVASCSPRTHEPLFQETLREAGLNPHLFEMTNIRDQCSWVHMDNPEMATEKSKDLLRMIIAKSAYVEPLTASLVDVTHSALVVGGGLAGMTAAMAIAEQGFEVTLIEKQKQLGGNLNNLKYTFEQNDIGKYLNELRQKIQNNEKITVRTQTQLESIEGFVGNFISSLKNSSESITYEHGAVVVATGGSEYKPTEYLYGQREDVITQLELEQLLSEQKLTDDIKSIVMIQCVGSREQGHMYCSRVCCNTAVKNALKIKELSPKTEIYILYRDMRTYGFSEQYFQQARDKGVIFIRYDIDSKPQISDKKGLKVAIYEPIIGEQIQLKADLLVLSSRIEPCEDNDNLAQLLKVPTNEDGFFLEAHVKLRPVEFATEGIFVAGLAHCPKNISETIAQAQAAAAKACVILSKEKYEAEARVSHVDISRCSACGTCTGVCAYKAIEIVIVDQRRDLLAAQVNPALCKGCGACAAACRSGAIDIKGITDHQINQMIKAL